MIVVETPIGADDTRQRWDGASVREVKGTYGDYALAKVAKVLLER